MIERMTVYDVHVTYTCDSICMMHVRTMSPHAFVYEQHVYMHVYEHCIYLETLYG